MKAPTQDNHAAPPMARARSIWFAGGLGAGLALLVGMPALWIGFLADDWSLAAAGAHMVEQDFWRPWRGAWLEPAMAYHWPAYAYYRPLLILSFGLDALVHGLRPWGCHATNLLLHTACTGLVFCLAGQVLRWTAHAHAAALCAAFLFAVHPIHEFNVLWVSGRTDLLCAFFFLAALVCWSHGRLRDSLWMAWPTALLGAAALASKEMAYSLPLVALAWGIVLAPPRDARAWTRLFLTWLPMAGVAAGFFLLRFLLFSPTEALGQGTGMHADPMLALYQSLRHLLLPFDIAFRQLPAPVLALAIAAAAAWGGAMLWMARRAAWRGVFLGGSLGGLALMPVLRLYMPWYLYLPSAGMCLALGAWIGPNLGRRPRLVPLLCLALLCGAYLAQRVERTAAWMAASRAAGEFASAASRQPQAPFLLAPGVVDDVPVFTHNLPAALGRSPGTRPAIAAYAAFDSPGPQATRVQMEVQGPGRVRLHLPQGHFVFPHPPGPGWSVTLLETGESGPPKTLEVLWHGPLPQRAWVYRDGKAILESLPVEQEWFWPPAGEEVPPAALGKGGMD